MKTLLKNFSIVLILFAIGSASCSKSDDSPPPPSPAELIAHKWFLKKYEDSSTTPPSVGFAGACEQNSYINFLSEGTVTEEQFHLDMNSTCFSSGIFAGTYDLSQNGQQFYVTSGSPPTTQVVTIDILTKTEFVYFNSPTVRLFYER